jgi:alpha-tubulin suppressor-like RCC1 family protein
VAGVSCIKATGIAAGFSHTCAVLSTGALECWGNASTGALGNGVASFSTFAFPVLASVSNVTQVAAGGYHTCALSGGAWKCFGDNEDGQIGVIGTPICNGQPCTLTPTALISGTTSFSTGNSDTCVVVSGQVQCLGDSTFGIIGETTGPNGCNGGTNNCAQSPLNIFSSLITSPSAVSAHNTSACAIVSGGNVVCWGEGLSGQIGPNGMGSICSGNDPCSPTPVAVPGVTNATAITTTAFSTCALISGGTVDCWGDNEVGQLGSSETATCTTQLTTACSTAPIQVAGLSGVTQIAGGDSFVCALLADGTVECWGDNGNHELGNASVTGSCQGQFNVCSSSPVKVSGVSGATAIAAGGYHACAIQGGGVVCWGLNSFGQLGNGNTTSSDTAVPVQF